MKQITLLTIVLILLGSVNIYAQKKTKNKRAEDNYSVKAADLSVFKFRSIGPAMISGRIVDLAVNSNNTAEYYVAAASGGVFKTTNSGITFTPVFDSQKSYSIGCVTIDPNNHNVVWVGTGENNSQRSVSWGDGVYRSLDGGASWKNMGLKKSEHIGKILIDPRNSNTIWVAAQGPLWAAGGDRGLYKSIDGGTTWNKVLEISDNTGVSDIAFDPNNPDVVYATSYQRRRHVYTLVDGGPESTIYKTEDGGKTFRKIEKGLPSVEKGRIGIAVSPANANYVYAIVEAAEGKGGFFRSTNKGESWKKMSSYLASSPQYYQEIFADPHDKNCVYSMDTYGRYTLDGGKSFTKFTYKSKHVDEHALWIDPNNTNHLLNGCDGGLYESFDRGRTWDFKANLPLSQFYRVSVDNDMPFYNVYGGTQDNNSVGGPSRTMNASGIRNSDWFITQGGDGFKSQIDPTDPNTVYAQYQYGGLARYNKRTGLALDIKPSSPDGKIDYRWNWDAPLIISTFNPKRLYFAANKLFKSDNRGDNWKVISPDLTRKINRNELKIMGKIQSPEAVAKNASTSYYGNIVSLDESPKKEGLLYVGTDDGLIQVSENGGDTWTEYSNFPGVPETTYVSCIKASLHDENIVFASFENHKRADFKPYILKSTDKGKTWKSIASNLPKNAVVWSIAQDHVNPDLLFVGTEYGLYISFDSGNHWIKFNTGIPNIAIRDIDIQKRENDIAVASYGRGFYILDDYSALRNVKPTIEKKKDIIFPIKTGLMFVPSHPIGWNKKGHLGDDLFVADNPKFGIGFTYYIAESYKTKKQLRKEEEKKKLKAKQEITYPSFEELRAEDNELASYLLFAIKDNKGELVRKYKAPITKGIHKIYWDYRYRGYSPVNANAKKNNISNQGFGMPAMPGKYTLEMTKIINDQVTDEILKQSFEVKSLYNQRQQANPQLQTYYKEMGETVRIFGSISKRINYQQKQLKAIEAAVKANIDNPNNMLKNVLEAKKTLDSLNILVNGDADMRKRNTPTVRSLSSRLYNAIYEVWGNIEGPTGTHKKDIAIVKSHNQSIITNLDTNKAIIDALNKQLDNNKVPYTPGR